jgi:hypothetical protein
MKEIHEKMKATRFGCMLCTLDSNSFLTRHHEVKPFVDSKSEARNDAV